MTCKKSPAAKSEAKPAAGKIPAPPVAGSNGNALPRGFDSGAKIKYNDGAAWVDGVIESWATTKQKVESYVAGTWGPSAVIIKPAYRMPLKGMPSSASPATTGRKTRSTTSRSRSPSRTGAGE